MWNTSEHKLQRHLNLPWVIPLRANHAEVGRAQGQAGYSKADVVSQVEELGPELKVETFIVTEPVVLEQTEVQIVDAVHACAGQRSGSGAVGERRRLAEDAGVEPLIQPGLRRAT